MTNLNNVKAISFDGDMTLWDFERGMRHSLSLALAELRTRVPESKVANLTVERMVEIRNEVGAELKGRIFDLEEMRLHAFKRTLESIGCPDDDLAADLNALYKKHRFDRMELYPDAIPTFDKLGSNFTIGLLSNGSAYPRGRGLEGRLKFEVFSQKLGIEKPDPLIFVETCKSANCEAHQLMHVGNSLESDVAGANEAGCISVWLNRNSQDNNSGIVPDYEIESLADLLDILNATNRE